MPPDHADASGVHTLHDGRAAYAARILLAEHARRALDVQYYIWECDLTGMLMADALYRAADRGVKVRLLLDDNNTAELENTLRALDAHPNIEVRLFNPFRFRRWRPLGYLIDFVRMNRRMHNKSLTADGEASIVGGRNIGDEYFDVADEMVFADLDVLTLGPVVGEVCADFARYWDSEAVRPLARVLKPADTGVIEQWQRRRKAACASPRAHAYREAVEQSDFVRAVIAGELEIDRAPARLVSDPPSKGLGRARDAEMLPAHLGRILGEPTRSLVLVSPYFVPTRTGVEFLVGLRRRGVAVTVLTNAFEATDVAVVHAGYAKRRAALLRHGVSLYEMRRDAPDSAGGRHGLPFGSSSSSLHAKTFSVDGERVFVGSFNFDPRSARLNTEMGVVVESGALARRMEAGLRERLPARAYALGLTRGGRVTWRPAGAPAEQASTREPGMSLFKRIGLTLLSWLPIEWLL